MKTVHTPNSARIMTTSVQPPGSQRWDRYPMDLCGTCKSKRALTIYHDRMAREEKDIFVSDGKPQFVDIWERRHDDNAFQPHWRASSSEQFDDIVGDGSPNPCCRFIFLYTATSRGKLCCTREQLNRVLVYHAVMPSFLDFCLEFKNKENPTTSTMFRFEDHLTRNQSIGNLRIQHAFNIIAPEEDRRHEDTNPWPIRHTAVYHSFDLDKAQSIWITVKANRAIRDRITSTGESLKLETTYTLQEQVTAQFAFSLSTHIHILEWCTEGWNGYIDHLEERVRKHATAIKLAPVEALSRRPPKKKPYPSSGPKATMTGLSHYSSNGPKPLGIGGRIRSNLSRMASGFSGHSTTATMTDSRNPIDTLGEKIADDDEEEELDGIFKFDDLQRIRQVTDDAEQTGMIIKENLRILNAIRDRYQDLIRALNAGNRSTSSNIDIPSLETLINNFCRQLSVIQGDLESYDARVQLLLRSLERNEEMFQGILQYGNMRVGEYYARSAETSAETMEKWTVAMHEIAAETEHETVSMHGITVLTLIFLPGTFVSTLFSSGIWDFDSSNSQNMGDWETRVPALKLFLAISLPLMAVALMFWWFTYRWAKGKHRIPSDWIPDSLRSPGTATSSGPNKGKRGVV